MDAAQRVGRIAALRSIIEARPGGDVLKLGAAAIARRSARDDGNIIHTRTTLDGTESEGLQRLLAMFEAVFLVAAADGELLSQEIDELAATLVELTGRSLPFNEIERLIEKIAASLEADDYEARAKSVAARLGDGTSQRTAFVMAVGMAHIDGVVQDEERDVFELLATAFGIPEDEAAALIESTRVRLEE